MRKELIKKLAADLKKRSLNSLAKEIDLRQPTLFRIVNKKSQGSIEVWEKIDSYYQKQKSA